MSAAYYIYVRSVIEVLDRQTHSEREAHTRVTYSCNKKR